MPTQNHCITCRHFWGAGKCEAFPGEIPAKIWQGDNDHREPYPGDHGIQFEPLPERAETDTTEAEVAPRR